MKREIEAVFFDLFETLVTESGFVLEHRAVVSRGLGISKEHFAKEWKDRQAKLLRGEFPDYPSVLRDICRAFDRPVDEAVIQRLTETRIAAKARPFACVEDSILRALEKVRGAGAKMGIISNAGPEEVASWAKCGLSSFFETAVFSHEVGCLKPEPGIYHLACDRLSVQPERCAFVGDGGSEELEGAEQIGMVSYWATWFLERWPHWNLADHASRQRFRRLRTPEELVTVIAND